MSDRISALKTLLERRPDDARLRFGPALECLNEGRTEEGIQELRGDLDASDDEGNAWGRLGGALRKPGRDEEALEAYRRGIEAASRHGHPTMAAEFAAEVEGWD